jgi:hypothetical protein
VRVGTILKKHLRNLRIITNVNVMHANRQKLHANCITINQVLISTIKKLALFINFIQQKSLNDYKWRDECQLLIIQWGFKPQLNSVKASGGCLGFFNGIFIERAR